MTQEGPIMMVKELRLVFGAHYAQFSHNDLKNGYEYGAV